MIEPQLKKGRKPKEKRYDTKFAKTLRTLLSEKEENGINLSTVADDLGITRQSLAQYRDGNNIPDIVVLGRMADYFDVTTDYLLGRTEVKSADFDAQKFCKRTGLSEEVFDCLCSEKSILEIEILNAFFVDNDIELYNLGYRILEKYEAHAFHEATFKKFVKDNNLPISDELIKTRGEYSLKSVFKGDEYFNLYARFSGYYQEWSNKLGIKKDLEEYNEFCLQKIAKNLTENTAVFFGLSTIADYYDKYYAQLLELKVQEDNEKIIELEIAKKNFLDSIISRKGAFNNGCDNPKKE